MCNGASYCVALSEAVLHRFEQSKHCNLICETSVTREGCKPNSEAKWVLQFHCTHPYSYMPTLHTCSASACSHDSFHFWESVDPFGVSVAAEDMTIYSLLIEYTDPTHFS